ncbi:hypothetical protein BGX38DRAFT_1156394 [Terfezia claveryi]|nr:hypothetical protein BGX38DRAFT_1156394 [Terfezia claveryi]
MQFSKITVSLLLALPTAFASISLGDAEALKKDEVTLGCLNTYNREVTECSKAEISSGSCSSDCATALNTLGKDIMLACRQAYAGPDTLLRKIVDGGLVVTMCKKTGGGSKDTSSTTAPAKDEATTTSSASEKTYTSVTETKITETTGTGEPTGAAYTDSSKSTDASTTEAFSKTTSASSTTTPSSDDSILGSNAAGRVGVVMSVMLGTVAAGVVSML